MRLQNLCVFILLVGVSCGRNSTQEAAPAAEKQPETRDNAPETATVLFPIDACKKTFNWSFTYGNDSEHAIRDFDCTVSDLVPQKHSIDSAELVDVVHYHNVVDRILWKGPRDVVAEIRGKDRRTLRIKFFWGHEKLPAIADMAKHMEKAKIKIKYHLTE